MVAIGLFELFEMYYVSVFREFSGIRLSTETNIQVLELQALESSDNKLDPANQDLKNNLWFRAVNLKVRPMTAA